MKQSKEEPGNRPSGRLGRLRSRLGNNRWADLWKLAIFLAAYFFAYKYAMDLSSRSGAPYWFPDSVLLSALLLSRRRIWWAFIAATVPVRLLVAAPPSLPTSFLILAFLNDSVKGVVAALLTQLALKGRIVRFSFLRDFWMYLCAAVLIAPALSAFAGAAMWLKLGSEFWPTWRNWFLGDGIANLICTPLLLCLAQDWRKIATAKPARYAEALVLLLTLPLAARIAYTKGLGSAGLIDPIGYLPFPLLMWAAIRYGPAGASCALSIVGVLSVAAAAGPSAAVSQQGAMDTILSMQLYIFVIAIPIMALSVLIEQQRSTEESFRESEQRFRNMADTAPVMIWMSGRDKLCTFFNASWLAFTGRAMELELGHGWATGVHPEDLDRCLQTYSSCFDARQKFQMEYRLRRSDGEYRWLLDDGIPLFEPGGVFAGYIGSCTDITELRRTQQETLARQKLESVGVLAGGIAHDFNNLLGGILVEAELAQTELAGGDVPLDGIQRIIAGARRGAEIVRELMIYAGQDKADPVELVDLSSLVKEMLELLKVSVSKHAVLKTDLPHDLPAVFGRASQIRQILMNLIINASEAIGSNGGVITVTTSRFVNPRDSDPKKVPQLPEGTYVDLNVSDTGCGMSEEALTKLFDPFFSTKFAGRGLGLAVVQGIVRNYGGAIHLVSLPGKGTTFEIFLPCSSEMPPPNSGEHARIFGQKDRSLGTVLVVEDEGSLRSAVAKMLRKNGFGVIEATDGSAALEQVRVHKNAIDVMLLDVTLPGMSSRDVFAEAQYLCPHVKVIFTSAYSRETVDAFVAGVRIDRFIRKPFQLVDLMAILRDALSS